MSQQQQETNIDEVTISIFAPFDTFIYLDLNILASIGLLETQEKVLNTIKANKEKNIGMKWTTEESLAFKLSKGVFTPPGEISSFLNIKLDDIPINEKVGKFLPNTLIFRNCQVYIHLFGVGSCTVEVNLKHIEGLQILELDAISETINSLFKKYFEDKCFYIAKQYKKAIEKAKIDYYAFNFLPTVLTVDKSKHFIPWTHRVYHIHDSKNQLFSLDNPGVLFSHLVTPSRQFDVKDFSIYDNRYIYFGWGHSIILTKSDERSFSYTDRPPSEYIRLVQISQANWQGINLLTQIMDLAFSNFVLDYSKLNSSKLKKLIVKLRYCNISIELLLDRFEGLSLTYDTEKRILYNELHKRWETQHMIERMKKRLTTAQGILKDLDNRETMRRQQSLNNIVFLFTLFTLIGTINLLLEISGINIITGEKLLIILGVTFLTSLIIIFYINFVGRD